MNVSFKVEETDRFSIKAELLRSTQYIEIVCPNDKQIIELFRNMKEESRCKSTNTMWYEAISVKHGSVVHEFDIFRMDLVTSLRWNDFVVNLIGEEFQINPLGESEKIVFTLKRRIEFVLNAYREFVLRKPIITTFTPCVAPYSSVILKPWTETPPKDLVEPNITPDRPLDLPCDIDIEDLIVNAEEMGKLASGVTSKLEENSSPEQKYIKFVLINTPVWNKTPLQYFHQGGVQEYLDSSDYKVCIDFSENPWIHKLLDTLFTGPIHNDQPFERRFDHRYTESAVKFSIRESEKFIAHLHWDRKVGVGCITINRDAECLNHLVDFIMISK